MVGERSEPPVPPRPLDQLRAGDDVVVRHHGVPGVEEREERVDLDLESAEGRTLLVQLHPRGGHVFERVRVVHDVGRGDGGEPPRGDGRIGLAE